MGRLPGARGHGDEPGDCSEREWMCRAPGLGCGAMFRQEIDGQEIGRGSLATGAAMGSAGTGADGSGSGFFQAMDEDRLGMCRGPAVGQHFFQTRVVRVQAE